MAVSFGVHFVPDAPSVDENQCRKTGQKNP